MKGCLLLFAALCLVALAADDAVTAPVPSVRPVEDRQSTIVDSPDAITIPQLLSYQGKLTDTLGIPVVDTTYSVNFRLYTVPSGGSPFWNETQVVRTRGGLFSVLLGSVTPVGSVPDAGAAYLGMVVAGGSELSPRLRIASAAYAYLTARAANSDLLQGRDTTTLSRSNHNHDAAYVNVTGDSMTGALAVGAQLRVRDKAALGYSCYNSGFAAFCAGYGNSAAGDRASVSGGEDNSANGQFSHIGGGSENRATARWTTAGGGNLNEVTDTAATVAGGMENYATAPYATVAGGQGNVVDSAHATAGGGLSNTVTGNSAVVAGGRYNAASGSSAVIGGGYSNFVSALGATVSGGGQNEAYGDYTTVSGGYENMADSGHATVSGGYMNRAHNGFAAVGGGYVNNAQGMYAAVGGGRENLALGNRSAVPGGGHNRALGYASLAAGSYAHANHRGSFVWGDSAVSNVDTVYTTGINQFRVRARGGTWFFSNQSMTTGAYLAPGSNSWASACDSASKTDFLLIDRRALLERVASLPVRNYRMKDQHDGTRHIGPVAQDFAAAFEVGENNTSINLADADGVLLAAVQALYEQNQALAERVAALEARLSEQ